MKKNVLTTAMLALGLGVMSNVASAADAFDLEFANKYIFKNKTMNSKTKGFTEFFDKNVIAKSCIDGSYNKNLATSAQQQSGSKYIILSAAEREPYSSVIESKKRAGENVNVVLTMSQSHYIEHQGSFVVNRDQKFDAELRVVYFKTNPKTKNTTSRIVILNKGSFNIKQSLDSTGQVKIEKILTSKTGKLKTTSVIKPLCKADTGNTAQVGSEFPGTGNGAQTATPAPVIPGSRVVNGNNDSTNIRF